MSLKFADHTPAEIEKRDNIRSKSKSIAGMQLAKALEGRLGLIIDSTAIGSVGAISEPNNKQSMKVIPNLDNPNIGALRR